MLVKESNRDKNTFNTKWDTYAYSKMPFGLTNVGATFQKAMDMAFKKMIEKIVLVYLDEITIYLKNVIDHFGHLRKVFIRCTKYGVSLNPSKCFFSTNHKKLLGHIVSKDGLTIDLERTKEILALSY